MADLLKHIKGSGFPFPNRLIHLFVGGSDLHAFTGKAQDLAFTVGEWIHL